MTDSTKLINSDITLSLHLLNCMKSGFLQVLICILILHHNIIHLDPFYRKLYELSVNSDNFQLNAFVHYRKIRQGRLFPEPRVHVQI